MAKNKFVHIGYTHNSNDMRIYLKECRSLSKYPNSEVIYVTSNKNDESESRTTADGIKIIIIPTINKRFVRIIKYLLDLKKLLLDLDADIYHIHEPWLLPLVRCLKKKKKKVIFDSHEFYYEQFKGRGGKLAGITAEVYSKYEKRICKKLDAVIYPCTLNGENVFEKKCKRTLKIDNYVILNDAISFNDYSCKDFEATLCYAGTLSKSRGITELIEAAFKANAKLILAGNFESNKYRAELEALEAYCMVDYRGYCTQKEIDEIYSKCMIGVTSLLQSGQYYVVDNISTKTYEYMQKKMPVIINDSPYVKKMLEKYGFGICVNFSNVDDIVEAINYIKNNPKIAQKMGEEGRKAIVEEYNWQNEELKLFELYTELLDENGK